eukprot:scaffold58878_cov54-Phaeocystis_antarctica.AAC.3
MATMVLSPPRPHSLGRRRSHMHLHPAPCTLNIPTLCGPERKALAELAKACTVEILGMHLPNPDPNPHHNPNPTALTLTLTLTLTIHVHVAPRPHLHPPLELSPSPSPSPGTYLSRDEMPRDCGEGGEGSRRGSRQGSRQGTGNNEGGITEGTKAREGITAAFAALDERVAGFGGEAARDAGCSATPHAGSGLASLWRHSSLQTRPPVTDLVRSQKLDLTVHTLTILAGHTGRVRQSGQGAAHQQRGRHQGRARRGGRRGRADAR